MSKQGIEADPKKIEAIQKWPKPKTVTQVRSFLGFTNYYRKFMFQYAQIAKPLNELTSGENSHKKNKDIQWLPKHQESFNQLKDLCTQAPILAYADYQKSFQVYTDASKMGLGTVLAKSKRMAKSLLLHMQVGHCQNQRSDMMYIS